MHFDSRPGDKIVLEPGRHQVQDIKVAWPLQLVGGGISSEDTVLECPESTSGALIFRCGGLFLVQASARI